MRRRQLRRVTLESMVGQDIRRALAYQALKDYRSNPLWNGTCAICGVSYSDRVDHLVTAHGWVRRPSAQEPRQPTVKAHGQA